MDFAAYGEVMHWDLKTLKFNPYHKQREFFSEKEIKKIMRYCIRGLNYCT